jgi:hypothetical protein
MKKLVTVAAVAAVALTPAAASAKTRTKVYKGTFELVGADGSYTSDKFGKAQLVDGRRNDKLSVHVRKLGSRAQYVFRLQSSATACKQAAPAGTDVPGWTYRRGGLLSTSRSGVANSWARSRTFTVDPAVEYFVGVFTRTASGDPDQLVACAQLTTKKPAKTGAGGQGKHGAKHHGKSGTGGKSQHKSAAAGNGQRTPGNSGKSHGNAGTGQPASGDGGNGVAEHGGSGGAHGQGRKARVSRR